MNKKTIKFWEKEAEKLEWKKKWTRSFSGTMTKPHWFLGGKINASYLCLDKNDPEKLALIYENELGKTIELTYGELLSQVNYWAAKLTKLNVKKGDVVILYLPLIPEAVAIMLACARIGAIHAVIFAGLGYESIAERIQETGAKLVITTEYTLRRGKQIPLESVVEKAVKTLNNKVKVVSIKRNEKIPKAKNIPPVFVESNHPLFVLYTSGTTKKPKGVVHSTGGYLTQVYSTFERTFAEAAKLGTYWCTADIGWITGHSYLVYGPLMHGSTVLIYEGAPDYPDAGQLWRLIEKHKVSAFYTAPTLIRMVKSLGEKFIKKYDLSSLKILGSVGEVLNEPTRKWYSRVIGHNKCPIIDTWWQTETGGFMIASDKKSNGRKKPMEGISAKISKDGELVIVDPWPGKFIRIWGTTLKAGSIYQTGDAAKIDKNGFVYILGRTDDTISSAGHRISPIELESIVLENDRVMEAAAVGQKDEIKGEKIVLFVVMKKGAKKEGLAEEISLGLRQKFGAIGTPAAVNFVTELPKTRSGKIIRRALKK
ncbi:MAG: AMP-binding protein [Candidatus Berkelbacteria bacterium]|nr:AMP-binding protein [Candidatus Berkelbacteria bacterium]